MSAPRSRGVIALLEPNCTACMICARECPDWCIHIESHSVVTPAPGGRGRPITETVLDRFAIDFGRCLYCGICVDVCPFDALHWAPDPLRPGLGDGAVDALVHERELLGEWCASVPAPPPLDPVAAPAPEVGPGASHATPRRPGGTPRSG